jgi:hypothetical protein
MKQAGFPPKWEVFEGLTKYSDWRFVAEINLLAAKPPPPPGTAATSSR